MTTQATTDEKGWIELTARAAKALHQDIEASDKHAVRLVLHGFD